MIRCLLWATVPLLLLVLMVLPGCGERTPDAPPVPAQVEADRLGLLAEGDAITAAGAAAEAAELERRARAAGDPANAARLAADAEAARLRAAIATARAEAARELRRDALARAVSERAEFQALQERAATAAAALEASKALDRDRRWAGIGLGACVAAAIALLICRLPAWIAIGGPAAVAGGLLWIAAWSSVPWLSQALGLALACSLLLALAIVAAAIVREWRRHADDVVTVGRAEADRRSLARQPAWLRPIVTRMLGARPAAGAPMAEDDRP